MATAPDPQDQAARPRLIVPGGAQPAPRPKIVLPGVGIIDPNIPVEPPPAEADAHLITEPLRETPPLNEPEIYLEDFLAESTEDDLPPSAPAEASPFAPPIELNPPTQPRPLGPPPSWTSPPVDALENIIAAREPIEESFQAADTWQGMDLAAAGDPGGYGEPDDGLDFTAGPESGYRADAPLDGPAESTGHFTRAPAPVPVLAGIHAAARPAPAVPQAAGQRVPHAPAVRPHATAPAPERMLPAWALLTVGLLIGLIGGVLAVAKTGAAAKIGLISTDRATAYATSILAEERGQIQAMLDEYYRNNRIQLAKEMEEFRKEQGRKPPEKMTMDDLLESDEAPPEKKPEAKEPEAKADTPAEPVPTDGKPKDAVE